MLSALRFCGARSRVAGVFVSSILLAGLALPAHADFIAVGHPNLDTSTEGTIFIFGVEGTAGTVTSNAGFNEAFLIGVTGVAQVSVPQPQFLNTANTVSGNAIFVESVDSISGYFLNKRDFSTDLTYLFDTDSLGTDYRVMAWQQSFGEGLQMSVTAVEDGTTVTIVPSVALLSGQSAGVPFDVSLEAGESMKFLAATGSDLTGSSIASTGPVAVFAGAACANVPVGSTACDHLFTQIPDTSNYSTGFIVPETANTGSAGNLVRILAATDNTEVTVNGALVATLDAGQFHEIPSATDLAIQATFPVMVGQYLKGNSATGFGDPAFSVVIGLDQALANYVFTTPVGAEAFAEDFLNIAIPTLSVPSLMLNGAAVDPAQFDALGATGYSVGSIPVATGGGTLQADAPFVASLSGFTDFDSYHTIVGATFSPGASPPALAIAPNPIDFGGQVVGTTSAVQSVTVGNDGGQDVTVSAVSAPTAPFVADGGTCGPVPFTLVPAASCTLDYTFSPTATGPATDAVIITSDAPSSPDQFDLAGSGIEASLALSTASVDFGNQAVGTTSAGQNVTVENTGDADLTVSALSTATAPFAADGGSCGPVPFTLVPAASCTLSYTFGPTAAGAAADTVTVTSNAPSSPDGFDLLGNGLQASLALSPAAVDFGNQVVGATSAGQSVTVENTGNADLTVSALSAATAPFAATGGTCGAVPFMLVPAETCTLSYTFGPTATGPVADAVTLTSNAPSSPDGFDLLGNGTQAGLALDVTSLSFDVRFGESATASVTASNDGDADLVIDGIAELIIPFSFEGGSCFPLPATLVPGGECTIEVMFAAGLSANAFSDAFDITSNSPSSPDRVTVQGNAQQPVAVPALDRFGLLLMMLLVMAAGGFRVLRRVA